MDKLNINQEKQKCANEDFALLLSAGSIAFYKTCEVTQVFLYRKVDKKVFNSKRNPQAKPVDFFWN